MHLPVLYKQIIHSLNPRPDGYYVDCTVGAGGHAFGILERSSPHGFLLGFDLDPQALELARSRLSEFHSRFLLVNTSYTALKKQLNSLKRDTVDGILLDLGVSSMQLDSPNRGFSFRKDAPLDMRFNPDSEISAAEIVNTYSEEKIAEIIHHYGEERHARRIARSIVKSRPIYTTLELADLILRVQRSRKKGKHPATRTFQALRIATNRELDALMRVMPQTLDVLSSGGRLAVISFHSLEDRIIKRFFRKESKDCICPPKQPICTCKHVPALKVITQRPIRPTDYEIAENPRSRSARLRVAERL